MSQIFTYDQAQELSEELSKKIDGLSSHIHIMGDAVVMDCIFTRNDKSYVFRVRTIPHVDADGINVEGILPPHLNMWKDKENDVQPWFWMRINGNDVRQREKDIASLSEQCVSLADKMVVYHTELEKREAAGKPPPILDIVSDTAELIKGTGAMSWWDGAFTEEFSVDIGNSQVDGVVMHAGRVRLTIATDIELAKKIMKLIKSAEKESNDG